MAELGQEVLQQQRKEELQQENAPLVQEQQSVQKKKDLGPVETERKQKTFVLSQAEMEKLGIRVMPAKEITWAYMEEKERIAKQAETERWSSFKTNKAYKDLNDLFVKEAKKAAKLEKAKAKGKLKADKKIREREHEEPVPVKAVSFSKKSFRLGKEERRDLSTKKRLEKKQSLKTLAEQDLKNPFIQGEMKELLKEIKEYSEIRATASTLNHHSSKTFLFIFMTRKEANKQKALDNERKLLKGIREKLNKLLASQEQGSFNREVLLDYRRKLLDRADGTLKLPEDQTKIIDVSKNDRVMSFSKLVKVEEDEKKEKDEAQEKKSEKEVKKELVTERLKTQDRSGEPLFAHEPCAKDVVQAGSFGDCYYMGAIASIVARDPELIRGMMKDEGDSVTVRFYRKEEGSKELTPTYIRVSKVVPEDGAGDTLWVKVLEKAYAAFLAQFSQERFLNDDEAEYEKKSEAERKDMDYVYMANGGNPEAAYAQLLGTESETIYLRSSSAQAYTNVYKALAEVYSGTRNAESAEINKEIRRLKAQLQSTEESLQKTIPQALQEEYDQKHERFLEAQNNGRTMSEEERHKRALEERDVDKRLNEAIMQAYQGSDLRTRLVARISELRERRMKLEYNQEKGLYTTPKAEESEQSEKEANYSSVRVYLKDIAEEIRGKAKQGVDGAPKEEQDQKIMAEFNNILSNLIVAMMDGDLKISKDDLSTAKRAKASYGRLRDAMQNLNPEEHAMSYPILQSIIGQFCMTYGLTEEEGIALVKKAGTTMLNELVSKFDDVFNTDSEKNFTGVYTENAIKIFEDIQKAYADGKYLTAGSKNFKNEKQTDGHAGERISEGIAGPHGYSVMGTEILQYKGKEMRFIKLRNAWGNTSVVYTLDKKGNVVPAEDESKTDGVGLVELNHFLNKFATVGISSKMEGGAA